MSINNSKHLIIGAGEVGRGLLKVLKTRYSVVIRDKFDRVDGNFGVLHIAYPASKNFVAVTKKYIKEYKPELTIVHSTVPVGTTRKIAPFVVHSPVRGVHPKIEKAYLA